MNFQHDAACALLGLGLLSFILDCTLIWFLSGLDHVSISGDGTIPGAFVVKDQADDATQTFIDPSPQETTNSRLLVFSMWQRAVAFTLTLLPPHCFL